MNLLEFFFWNSHTPRVKKAIRTHKSSMGYVFKNKNHLIEQKEYDLHPICYKNFLWSWSSEHIFFPKSTNNCWWLLRWWLSQNHTCKSTTLKYTRWRVRNDFQQLQNSSQLRWGVLEFGFLKYYFRLQTVGEHRRCTFLEHCVGPESII